MNFFQRFPLALILASLAFTAGAAFRAPLHAETPAWSQCPDKSSIARCETYNCPKGDTNQDGACTLVDSGASLSDTRNDSLCANPLSGCGEVRYFSKNTTIACAVRVKESGSNCNLYSAGNPSFITPTPLPTASPRATFQPVPTSTPLTKGGQTASPSAQTLPETGPGLFATLALIFLGFFGIYLYERYRPIS